MKAVVFHFPFTLLREILGKQNVLDYSKWDFDKHRVPVSLSNRGLIIHKEQAQFLSIQMCLVCLSFYVCLYTCVFTACMQCFGMCAACLDMSAVQ